MAGNVGESAQGAATGEAGGVTPPADPGVVGGIDKFEPNAGAVAPGDGNKAGAPAVAGDPAGTPKGSAEAPPDGTTDPKIADMQAKLDAATARSETLQSELDDAIGRRKGKVDELQEVKATLKETLDRVESGEKKLRSRDAVASVLEKIPPSQQKLARAVIIGLPNATNPIDLAGEDHDAVVKQVQARLKEDHPSLLEATEAPPRNPKIPSGMVGPNGIPAPKVGKFNARGVRIL